MIIDITYHYPPELLQLLIETIPKLCPYKKDVFVYFRGAGVEHSLLVDLEEQVRIRFKPISKYEITRTVLERLNQGGERKLRERREVLKRVCEWHNFATCWNNDRNAAIGLVAQIRELVNAKDTITRITKERDQERQQRIKAQQKDREIVARKKRERDHAKDEFFKLFAIQNPHERGRQLEPVLGKLFKAHGISGGESFHLVGEEGEGIVQQIDGTINFDGHDYLLEMKWWQKPIGVDQISSHLVRIFTRAEARAIIISGSDFTDPAITQCKDALAHKIVVLMTLTELVQVLENGKELLEVLRKKVTAAISQKMPYYRVTQEST